MRGVQHEQPHTGQYPFVDPVGELVVHLGVRRVAPPGQDVGRLEDVVRQPLLRLVEDGGADVDTFAEVRADGVGDGPVHTGRVALGDVGLGLLVPALAPHRHPQHATARPPGRPRL
jgi:hypothetical protein